MNNNNEPRPKYRIYGKYETDRKEEIDTAKNWQEAKYLAAEYRMAYGEGWRIWIVRYRRTKAEMAEDNNKEVK